jgi:hypothetical protein
MPTLVRSSLGVALAATLTATPAGAQLTYATSDSLPPFARRASASLGVVQMRPQGDFNHNIDFGYGLNGTGLLRLDRLGIVHLRLDLGFAQYGSETKRVPLSETVGGRVLVDVVTNNSMFVGGIGPHLMIPRGPVRPYVHGAAGFAAFATSTRVEDTDNSEDSHFSTNNHDDGTFSWSMGTGVLIPVRYGRTHVDIDLGMTYYTGGEASYLRPGSIRDLPGGAIQITPMRSKTDFALWRIGVRLATDWR